MRRSVVVSLMAIIAAIGHPAAQEAQDAAPQERQSGAPEEQDAPPTQEGQDPSADARQPILLPEVTTFVRPVYPPTAISARVSGWVIAGVTVDGKGSVQSATITRSTPGLDQAVLEAIQQWEFTPPMVDGQPVPTGFNVSVEFVLGPAGGAPTPSVPDSRPSWIPEDFAFEYEFACRDGRGSIDMQTYRPAADATAGSAIQFTVDEIQSIYLRMFAAGGFSIPGETWREDPKPRTAADGFALTVLGKQPQAAGNGAAGGRPFRHVLDVRHYGAWRRIEWAEPDYERRPELHEQLETIGQLIREIVARKPDIQALPAEQRPCLPR